MHTYDEYFHPPPPPPPLWQGKVVGVFMKDSFTGDFVEGWKGVLGGVKVTQVDVSAAFAYTSAPKDESEVNLIKVGTH